MRHYRKRSTCPKCGHGSSEWDEPAETRLKDDATIERTCPNCNHSWDERTHDAPKPPKQQRWELPFLAPRRSGIPIPIGNALPTDGMPVAEAFDRLKTLASGECGECSKTTLELCRLLESRDALGRKKYPQSLDREDLLPSDWEMHHLEELLDAAGYTLRGYQKRKRLEMLVGRVLQKFSELQNVNRYEIGFSEKETEFLASMEALGKEYGNGDAS